MKKSKDFSEVHILLPTEFLKFLKIEAIKQSTTVTAIIREFLMSNKKKIEKGVDTHNG